MKNFLLFFCFCGVAFFANAQSDYKPATEPQQQEMIQKITEASEKLNSLRCDFVQKKTISMLSKEMVSEGQMYFKQKDKLKWEYTKPTQFELILNGNQVLTNSGNTKNAMTTNSSKAFRKLSKIILSMINGSGIFDPSMFTAQLMVGTKDNMVILNPTQKEMQQMFSVIRLRFNKSDYTVNVVEMEEKNGDSTRIEMKNKQVNIKLNDEIFTITKTQ